MITQHRLLKWCVFAVLSWIVCALPCLATCASPFDDDVVSILWFPQNPDFEWISHVKLGFEDEAWNTLLHFRKEGSLPALQRLAESDHGNPRHAFYQFDIKLGPKESKRLRAMLQSGIHRGYPIPLCVQGACHLINWATRRPLVPFPFNQTPTSMAVYLSISRWMPWSRIQSVRYFGTQTDRMHRVLNDGIVFDLKVLAIGSGLAALSLWLIVH